MKKIVFIGILIFFYTVIISRCLHANTYTLFFSNPNSVSKTVEPGTHRFYVDGIPTNYHTKWWINSTEKTSSRDYHHTDYTFSSESNIYIQCFVEDEKYENKKSFEWVVTVDEHDPAHIVTSGLTNIDDIPYQGKTFYGTVKNTGEETLYWDTDIEKSWLVVSPESGTLSAGSTKSVSVEVLENTNTTERHAWVKFFNTENYNSDADYKTFYQDGKSSSPPEIYNFIPELSYEINWNKSQIFKVCAEDEDGDLDKIVWKLNSNTLYTDNGLSGSVDCSEQNITFTVKGNNTVEAIVYDEDNYKNDIEWNVFAKYWEAQIGNIEDISDQLQGEPFNVIIDLQNIGNVQSSYQCKATLMKEGNSNPIQETWIELYSLNVNHSETAVFPFTINDPGTYHIIGEAYNQQGDYSYHSKQSSTFYVLEPGNIEVKVKDENNDVKNGVLVNISDENYKWDETPKITNENGIATWTDCIVDKIYHFSAFNPSAVINDVYEYWGNINNDITTETSPQPVILKRHLPYVIYYDVLDLNKNHKSSFFIGETAVIRCYVKNDDKLQHGVKILYQTKDSNENIVHEFESDAWTMEPNNYANLGYIDFYLTPDIITEPGTYYSRALKTVSTFEWGDEITDTKDWEPSLTFEEATQAELSLITPTGGEIYFVNEVLIIEWNSNNLGTVKIELLLNGQVVRSIIEGTDNDGSYTWPIPGTFSEDTNYQIKITSTNDSSISSESESYFSILKKYSSGFVQTSGQKFTLDNNEFKLKGLNAYYLYDISVQNRKYGTYPGELEGIFQFCKNNGINVIRTWGFYDQSVSELALRKDWDEYNEENFNCLDEIVFKAQKYGIKLIIPLINYWDDYGGIQEYVYWYNQKNGTSLSISDFYTSSTLINWYKNYITKVVARYKNSSAIFAWEVANEPRQGEASYSEFKNWVAQIASHIKSIDDNHLVGLGDEGDYNGLPENNEEYFTSLHGLSQIDFSTLHLYVEADHLNTSSTDELAEYLSTVSGYSNNIGKPLIIEEFGIKTNYSDGEDKTRLDYFQTIKNSICENNIAGSCFWVYMPSSIGWNAQDYEVKEGDTDIINLFTGECEFLGIDVWRIYQNGDGKLKVIAKITDETGIDLANTKLWTKDYPPTNSKDPSKTNFQQIEDFPDFYYAESKIYDNGTYVNWKIKSRNNSGTTAVYPDDFFEYTALGPNETDVDYADEWCMRFLIKDSDHMGDGDIFNVLKTPSGAITYKQVDNNLEIFNNTAIWYEITTTPNIINKEEGWLNGINYCLKPKSGLIPSLDELILKKPAFTIEDALIEDKLSLAYNRKSNSAIIMNVFDFIYYALKPKVSKLEKDWLPEIAYYFSLDYEEFLNEIILNNEAKSPEEISLEIFNDILNDNDVREKIIFYTADVIEKKMKGSEMPFSFETLKGMCSGALAVLTGINNRTKFLIDVFRFPDNTESIELYKSIPIAFNFTSFPSALTNKNENKVYINESREINILFETPVSFENHFKTFGEVIIYDKNGNIIDCSEDNTLDINGNIEINLQSSAGRNNNGTLFKIQGVETNGLIINYNFLGDINGNPYKSYFDPYFLELNFYEGGLTGDGNPNTSNLIMSTGKYAFNLYDHINPQTPSITEFSYDAENHTLGFTIENIDPDIYYYKVFRKIDEEFEEIEKVYNSGSGSVFYVDYFNENINTVYYKIQAVDISGNESPISEVFNYNNSLPEIYIIWPLNNYPSTQQNITITGSVTQSEGIKQIEIKINDGEWIITNGNSKWNKEVRLNQPNNVVKARAQFSNGNYSEIKTINIHFSSWVEFLSDEITLEKVAGDDKLVNINSNTDWEISTLPTWLIADKTAGTGDDNIVFTTQEDNNTGSNRSHTVTLSNSFGDYNELTIKQLMEEMLIPQASFTYSPTDTETNLQIQFTDQSVGNPTSYQWDFGDGSSISTEPEPTHIYSTKGTYTVTLTVENENGSTTQTKSITVSETDPDVIADFTSDITKGTAPLTVQFTDQSTGTPTSWRWDFGDGSSESTEQNPSHMYTESGIYTVSLTASNDNGSDHEIKENYISVYEKSIANLNVGLLHYYPIDENYDDVVGTNNWVNYNGQIAEGKLENAVEFNNQTTGHYAEASSVSLSNEASISCWFYSRQTQPEASGILFKAYGSPHGDQSIFGFQSQYDSIIAICNYSNGLSNSFWFPFNHQNWYHLVLVFDGTKSTMNVYVNGTLFKSIGTDGTSLYNPDSKLKMGMQKNSSRSFYGKLDEIGIWNKALTADEVTTLYNNGNGLAYPFETTTENLVADFTSNIIEGTAPLNVQFTDQSTGTPTSWLWDFGDGSGGSTEQNPSHVFTESGIYTVSLTASNDNGSDQEIKENCITVIEGTISNYFQTVWIGNGTDHMNFNVVSAKIDGVDLVAGDEIGLFDDDLCVGAGVLTSTANAENIFSMVASANDGSGNGYTAGNNIVYKLYKRSTDEVITNVAVTYRTDMLSWVTDGKYEINGTAVVEIEASSNITQNISLNTGWNIISSKVIPIGPDMKTLLQPLINEGKLRKVMDESGKSLEDLGAFLGGWKNNIGDLSQTEGYKVNVIDDCSLELEGAPIAIPLSIPLNAGWNIISFPASGDQDGKAVVQTLINEGKMKKVMNEAGLSIEDLGGFLGGWKNNIGDLKPGKGYKINVNTACELILTNDLSKSAMVVPELLASTYFKPVFTGNGTDHMNINLVELRESGWIAGDEIGVFDGNLCVGSATIAQAQMNQNYISIPVSMNDGLQILSNGYTQGNIIQLRSFRQGNDMELNYILFNGNYRFAQGESMIARANMSDLTDILNLTTKDLTISCYPNPFKNSMTIQLDCTEPVELLIQVFDVIGKKRNELFHGTIEGSHNIEWDGTDENGILLKQGNYFIKVNEQIIKVASATQ